jgi:hypothetical protein
MNQCSLFEIQKNTKKLEEIVISLVKILFQISTIWYI